MKYCKHCGKEIGDAKFCPHCGKPQHTEQESRTGRRRLHCPQCRSEQLSAVTEATQTGGVATSSRLTRNVAVTGYSANTVNRHYWMCQECGHKFRNLEDLNDEIMKESKQAKGAKIAAIVFGVFCLFIVLGMMADEVMMVLMLMPAVMLLLICVIFFVIWLTTKKKVERMTAEKVHLERHCFD